MTEQHLRLPILLSIAAAIVTMALKTAAWWVTGSVGLLSDAAESVVVLEADGQHLLADVWTSVGVLVGLGLVRLTEHGWLDPVVALLVAANILWTGWSLVRRSFHGLMDRALPDEELTRIRSVITSHL